MNEERGQIYMNKPEINKEFKVCEEKLRSFGDKIECRRVVYCKCGCEMILDVDKNNVVYYYCKDENCHHNYFPEKEVVIQRLLNRRKEIQAEIGELMDEDIKVIVELHNLGKVIEGYEIPF